MSSTDTITDAPRARATPMEWIARPGHAPYEAALTRMAARVAAIRHGEAAECVELLEHPPLLTAGTSARDADLLDAGALPVHRVGRGGQWTYHGPGQRIAYVMLDLERAHGSVPARDIRAYVAGLERWLIAALAAFGLEAGTRDGRVGLWVTDAATGSENKIAAIGVRVTRWVTWHGIALNVAPDLAAYDRIVPCGITAHGVTSLRALGSEATLEDVDAALRRAWTGVFGGAT